MKCWWRFLTVVWLSIVLSLRFSQSLQAQILPSRLVEQAQVAYQSGEFQESIELLKQANQAYQNRDQYLQQAQILTLTSLAQQQIGKWELAQANITKSLAQVDSIPASKDKTQVLAQIWNTKGNYEFLRNNDAQAIAHWQQAEELYRQVKDSLGVAGSQLDRVQALSRMGFHARGCNLALKTLDSEYSCKELTSPQLTAIINQATVNTQPWTINALNSISNSLLLMGNFSQAIALTKVSQKINSHQTNSSLLITAKTWLNLGNINKAIAFQAQEREDEGSFNRHVAQAVKFYQKLTDSSISKQITNKYKVSAQLNLLSLYVTTQNWLEAQQLVKEINLDDQSNLYAPIKLAGELIVLKKNKLEIDYSWQDIAQIYLDTAQQAKIMGDRRIRSYALGNLGILQIQQPNLKLDNTPEQLLGTALSLSQQTQALELSYRWQWKLGQVYRQQDRRELAISSYKASLTTLADLRSDLATLNKELQFDFREQIEPIYRELVSLLLDSKTPSDQDLETARNVIEALQVAELDNYFQDACLTFEPKSIAEIDPNSAMIYTIVLPDRLEVIMATSNSDYNSSNPVSFRHHTELIAQTELESTIEQLRQYITEPDRTLEVQQLSAQIYDWLIKPFTEDLEANKPETLVFVLDSILQPIPMSVLYDGKQYLLEQYALALTPGLRLLNPQAPATDTVYVAGGITQSLQVGDRQFSPLDNVTTELTTLSETSSSIIINQEFTPQNLLNQINNKSASHIHIATHGQFSSNPNQTFLLMWHKLLTIKEFSQILLKRNQIVTVPIDLLVLSACDTALGDRRAALGLAGIAVRSGALSTLATLWQVNDESTAILMKNFYQNLESGQNKAKALQQAQLKLWQTPNKDWQVPTFWSSYILIGNW